jgi:hypothetical protein
MASNVLLMDKQERLDEIAQIIEGVDNRAQVGDFVTPTLDEMTQGEMSRIYELAKGQKIS